MKNIKQRMIEETANRIVAKEQEIRGAEGELAMLKAELKVESTILAMKDLKEHLRENFTYAAQALEGMLSQEQEKIAELKNDLEMLVCRKEVIESQFSSDRDFLNE